MMVRVRLDRTDRTWSWESIPTGKSNEQVRSPTVYSTAQAAISAAQAHHGPGLTIIV